MIYEPFPIGRICRKCNNWKPRADLVKDKRQPFGVEKHCLDCAHQKNKQWADNHPDSIKASRARWDEANPGKTDAAIRRWQKNNPDKSKEIERRYAKNHPEQARAKVQLRNARKRLLPSTFSQTEWQRCLEYWHIVCAYCGNGPSPLQKTRVLIQEHFIPITMNGPYTADNIVPACKSCNSQKQDLDPAEWVTRRFGEREATAILERIAIYFEWVKSQDHHNAP